MNTWVIKDRIKSGIISFEEGDDVICFWKKGNGYPRSINDGEIYKVSKVESDHLYLIPNDNSRSHPMRVHKTYMIPLYILREIKLNSLLDETKLI